ncbi:MAG: hypothetical protein Q7U97_10365 [Rhodocyclaceae bacterium]|nr:hypothetical protein [Rhodocyclaceae bacterium]
MTNRLLLARACLPVLLISISLLAKAQEPVDVALITSLQGNVERVTLQGPKALQSFVKLKQGDLLALRNARIQIVYFESGRQEVWQGGGRLEILGSEGRPFGLPDPEVKILPSVMVKQIARTPALDSQGRAGVMRLRSIASPEAIAKLDNTYRQMRMEAVRGDLNPELFLLSGLFEMRELARVEQVLKDLQQARPGDTEVSLVVTLYQKAIKNAREAHAN